MRRNASHLAWKLDYAPLLAGVFLLCVFLAFLLARGTSGGDEGEAIRHALLAGQNGWSSILTSPDDAIRAHRLFWAVEKYVLNQFFLLIVPSSLYGQAILRDALLTMDGSLFMLLTGAVGWFHLRSKGHGNPVSSLAIACLLLASSAVSLFAGGAIECLMCLLAMIMLAALDTDHALSRTRFLVATLSGLCLIFCKEYALLFLLPLAWLMVDRRQRLWFLVLMLSGAAAWFFMFIVGAGLGGGAIGFYQALVSVDTFRIFSARLFNRFFSLPFGLVWCFPFIFVAALSWKQNQRALLAKSVGAGLLFFFLTLFPFSFGPGAVAGPRYVVPFLLFFLPEVADGIDVLRHRWRLAVFAIPVTAAFFMPALDYRNSLISRWVPVANRAIAWPHGDIQMHPGIFAWRVVAAKTWDMPSIRISRDLPYVVSTHAIFPMSGLSRIIYALQSWTPGKAEPAPDPRLQRVSQWLALHRLDNLFFWHAVRAIFALSVLAWLFHAALSLSGTLSPDRRRTVVK